MGHLSKCDCRSAGVYVYCGSGLSDKLQTFSIIFRVPSQAQWYQFRPDYAQVQYPISIMAESPVSDQEKNVNGQDEKNVYTVETTHYNADEGIGENKEFGEVKDLR